MQKEPGDDYIRRIAQYIRSNSHALAGSSPTRRGPPASQATGIFAWIAKPDPPVVYTTDLHHIFYLLMRFEELGVDVGPLDVRLPAETISRPLSYVSLLAKDKSDTGSVFSLKSISGVSGLSLGAGWWPRIQPLPSVETEIKSIYSAFTKIPALSIHQSSLNVISELADDPPVDHVVPLWPFKNLQSLECVDIDPRMVMGWDRLAESLRSLTLRKSGIEDLTEVFVDAVLEDQARRRGEAVKTKRRRMLHRNTADSRRPSWRGPAPPISIQEEPESETVSQGTDSPPTPSPQPPLSGLKWAFLKHLSLSDNSLTFFPTNIIPHLLSVTYLDLSSNLLVSVPSGLNQLYNLIALNLSDNMIESVLGIYTMLGQVLTLNLSRNRIESLCGLERLVALERIDVRKNQVVDIGEIGRLATLPNLQGVWIDGNPFTIANPDYRIACFNQFLKEGGKNITLDGLQPSFIERRNLIAPPPITTHVPFGMKSPGLVPSPPVVAVGSQVPVQGHATSTTASPAIATGAAAAATAVVDATLSETTVNLQNPARRKRPTKRLVDLDGAAAESIGGGDGHGSAAPKPAHRRGNSEVAPPSQSKPAQAQHQRARGRDSPRRKHVDEVPIVIETPTSPTSPKITSTSPPRKSSHHTRGLTMMEGSSSSSASSSPPPPPAHLRSPKIRSPTLGSGFATVSGNGSVSKRQGRAKLSAAIFSPTLEEASLSGRGTPKEGGADSPRSGGGGGGGGGGSGWGAGAGAGAGAFRAEIEALRASAPDNWLKVLSQKQFGSSAGSGVGVEGHGNGNGNGGSLRVGSPGTDGQVAEGRRRRHLRGATEF